MPEAQSSSQRVRINATQDAKGFFKIEATFEMETFDGSNPIPTAAIRVQEAIHAARNEFTRSGLKYLADPKDAE